MKPWQPIPMNVRFAMQGLVNERDARKEFVRVYGRDRGSWEYGNRLQYTSAGSARNASKSLIRQAFEIARRNRWDWREICADIIQNPDN